MRSLDARTIGLLAAATALAGCHPPKDVRPPYHEPNAAKPAPLVPTWPPAEPPVR